MSVPDLRCLERIAVGDVAPDLRLLLDLPVEEGLERRHRDSGTVNRIDRAGLAFHRRVREMYLHLVASSPNDWVVIDAARSPEAVLEDICQAVESVLAISLAPPGAERQV